MDDRYLALLFLALAALMVVPLGLFARWLELRFLERRGDDAAAE